MAREIPDTHGLTRPIGSGGVSRFAIAAAICLSALVFFAGYSIMRGSGVAGLAFVSGIVLAIVVLAFVSTRYIEIAVLVWLASVSGFRNLTVVDLPGLPDISLDRILLFWVIAVLILRAMGEKRRGIPPYLLDTLIVVHTVFLLGSCLLTNPEIFNLWTRSYLMPAAAFFFGKYLVGDEKWFRRSIDLFILVSLYLAFTAIAEHHHWTKLVWPRWILTTEHQYLHRSVGIFLQPGVLGIFLGMILPFHFHRHICAKHQVVRWFFLFSIALCLVGLYYTYTRGTWIATGAGILTLAAIRTAYRRRIAVYAVIVCAIGVMGVLSVQRDPFLQKRLKSEHTITGRIAVLGTTARIWIDNPILGVGFLRYKDVKADYRATINVPVYGMIKSLHDERSVPHDIYVGILAEEGLVGASMQFGIYFLVIRYGIWLYRAEARRRNYRNIMLLTAMIASGMCYFVGGWSFDYRYFETLNAQFYFFAGVLVRWKARTELESLQHGLDSGARAVDPKDRIEYTHP